MGSSQEPLRPIHPLRRGKGINKILTSETGTLEFFLLCIRPTPEAPPSLPVAGPGSSVQEGAVMNDKETSGGGCRSAARI